MSGVGTLSVVGNHEVSNGHYNGVDWMQRYPAPFRESGSPSAMYYSYNTGLVHVLGLNSYAPMDEHSPQYSFALQDLKNIDPVASPWVIVIFHAPWYSSNQEHYEETVVGQRALEGLFYEYGVDLVLSGHVHSYERTYPVYNSKVDWRGPIHICIGDGGNYGGPALPWREPQPEWSAFREASFGSGQLTVHNQTHAHWEWQRAGCGSKPGGIGETPEFLWTINLEAASCTTVGDNSAQRGTPVDRTWLVQDKYNFFSQQTETASVDPRSSVDPRFPAWGYPLCFVGFVALQVLILGATRYFGGTDSKWTARTVSAQACASEEEETGE